ncbi:hypothetical protein N8I77_008822 [Diaporthe amygdali]|uniref:Uncharacterized protein n=1 Tax=Phomopsis amygdali TaxID=1214568 RepID=A0AAD9SBD8_PHOAM|nr:hypothetical protein N8I77_008822 [Diaporthe amygdali]
MPSYTDDQLDDLEEAAETSTPQDQKAALAIVSGLLERNAISYGVMGGMNFYLRGSGRATGDVDIAVDNPPRMDSLLTIFNSHPNIYRPGNRMQWASGVARLFVSVQGRLVQVDLKPKGAEGHLIPSDLARAVDTLQLSTTTQCKVLSIGPLVAAKIKAHYNRETNDDYRDLMFVCRSATYAPLVREAAGSFRAQWKESFLEKVIDNNPELERQVRWALNMDRSPSPKDKKSGGGGGGGGNDRGGRGGGGGSSRSSSPRDGDRSSDGYWTYSSRNKGWYHVHGDGRTSWRDQPSSSSQSKSSSSSTAQRSSDKTRSRDTGKSSAPRDGDKSKDGYWTYSSRNGKWYHRHSDGKVSYAS